MARLRSLAATVLALAAGCEGAPAPSGALREAYALSRLSLDPVTEIGDLLAGDPALAAEFGIEFGEANCDGPLPIVVQLDAEGSGARAEGTISMVVGMLDGGQPCDGTGVFAIVAGVVDGEPIVRGPLFVEGSTAEARLPLSRIDPALSFLPTWWRVIARRRQGSDRFTDAEASALWRPSHVVQVPSMRTPGASLLDDLVALGAQPDLDVDRDGLEALLDTDDDGHVDACLDGDGARIDGPECASDGRIVDGFEIIIRFRLVPVELVAN